MAIPSSFSGGCACRAVRYRATAAPVLMLNCHCRDCQHASGGPFAAVLAVPRAAFALTAGELRYHESHADSGNVFRRGFCPTCGSPVIGEGPGIGELVAIRAGSLDDPSWFEASVDLWTERAIPSVVMAPALPRFPRQFVRGG